MSSPGILSRAAAGSLPDWSVMSDARRAHVERVADVLEGWASAMGLSASEAERWRAAGMLHDVLRDADPEELRAGVPADFAELPGQILHGPAAAERLRVDGVLDGEFLTAVQYHTLGSERLGRLGRALYCADFLEPGRDFLPEWRAELRDRAPSELDRVTREIVGARIQHLIDRRIPFLAPTVTFWNALVEGE